MKARNTVQTVDVKPNKVGYVSRVFKKPKVGFIFRSVVAGSLLYVVITRVDFSALLRLFERIDYFFFLIFLFLLLADRFLMAFKWILLTDVKNVKLSVWQGFKIYLISNFIGVFLPTGIGGDIFRIYYTSKITSQTEVITASVIMERLMGIIASAIFAVIGLSILTRFNSQPLLERSTVVIIFICLTVSLVMFWVSIQRFTLTGFKSLLGRWQKKRFISKFLQFHEAYLEYRKYRGVLLLFAFLSIIEQGLYAVASYWGARALGINTELIYFIGIIPIIQILIRIPISINAIGVQEGLYTFFFSQVGMSVTEAFTLSFFMRIGLWLIVIPGAILYLTGNTRKERSLQHR